MLAKCCWTAVYYVARGCTMAPFRAQFQAPFLETLGRAARDVDGLWDATAASTAVGSVVADAHSHARPKIAPIFSYILGSRFRVPVPYAWKLKKDAIRGALSYPPL